MKATALELVRAGFGLVPMRGGSDPKASKVPWMTWTGLEHRRASEGEVESWFARWPKMNIGCVLATAPAPDGQQVVCVDSDTPEVERWIRAQRPLPPTPTAKTARGFHRYFVAPADLGHFPGDPDLGLPEVRAGAHLVVLPPSVHYTGHVYEWCEGLGLGEVDFAELPAWGLALMPEANVAPDPGEEKLAAKIPEGARDNTLFKVGCRARHWGMEEAEILALLHKVNTLRCVPPLDAKSVQEKARQAALYAPALDLVQTTVDEEKVEEVVQVCTAEDLAERIGDMEWAWPGWWPVGMVTVLAGEAGSGKSATGLWLAATIAQGLPWPDGAPNEYAQGPTLVLDSEGCQALWAQRVKDWGVPGGSILLPGADGFGKVAFDSDKDRAAVGRICQREGVRALILDSLRAGLGAAVNENDSAIGSIISGWAELARDLEIPLLLLHHLSKRRPDQGREAGLERLRGSGAIGAAARVVWGLDQPDPEAPIGRLRVMKSNVGGLPDGLGLEVGGEGITWSATAPRRPKEETAMDRAKAWLFDWLRLGPQPIALTLAKAEEDGHLRATVYRAKEVLRLVKAYPPGRGSCWSLPANRGGS